MDMSMPIATHNLIFLIFIILVEQLLKNNYIFKEQLKTFKRTKKF